MKKKVDKSYISDLPKTYISDLPKPTKIFDIYIIIQKMRKVIHLLLNMSIFKHQILIGILSFQPGKKYIVLG